MASKRWTVFGLEDLIDFRCSPQVALDLVSPILTIEIKAALFSLPADKCPGPDGYTMELYHATWSIFGNDMLQQYSLSSSMVLCPEVSMPPFLHSYQNMRMLRE